MAVLATAAQAFAHLVTICHHFLFSIWVSGLARSGRRADSTGKLSQFGWQDLYPLPERPPFNQFHL
jgi:hypothetical protein